MLAAVTFTEWTLGVGFVVSTLSFVFTLFKFLNERREKRAESARRGMAEIVLRETQRRADAPFLMVRSMYAENHTSGEPAVIEGRHITIYQDTRLTFRPGEAFAMDRLPAEGAAVCLVVVNHGRRVRAARITQPSDYALDAALGHISEDNAGRLPKIIYPFLREHLGQAVSFTLEFESLDGVQQRHIYETRHGACELRRIDPS